MQEARQCEYDVKAFPCWFSYNHCASPLLHEGLAYVMSSDGVLTVIDAATGEVVYQKMPDFSPLMGHNASAARGGCAVEPDPRRPAHLPVGQPGDDGRDRAGANVPAARQEPDRAELHAMGSRAERSDGQLPDLLRRPAFLSRRGPFILHWSRLFSRILMEF